jgi:peptidoglycan hydrolase-like protein with peptidoglycan-binding domain
LSGSLSAATRSAISAYQQDNGLVVNGVVDAPLVYSLGLQ